MDKIQERALSTWHKELDIRLQYQHALLGLIGEAGELANLYKKQLFKPGHFFDRLTRIDELGDVLYYLSILAKLDGVTLDDVSRLNYEKLTKNGDNHGWQPDYYNDSALPR